MENIYWKKTAGTLIGAIWLYTLADLAASISGAVNDLLNPSGALEMIGDLMNGESGTPTLNAGDIIESMFSILVIVGYYLFFRSLTRFSRLQANPQDSAHVSTVRTAYVLLLVALIVDFIPVIGWLAGFVLMIIAYIKMLSGYRGLKKSSTFPFEARKGASTLYACTIWTLVGYVLGCIPLIGGIIEGIITLVVFFMVLSAWGQIKNDAPNMTPEEEEAFKRGEVPAEKQILGDALIIYFFLLVASSMQNLLPIVSIFADNLSGYIGYQLVWLLAGCAPFVWLLCSPKAKLNLAAKAGIGFLLTSYLSSMLGIFFTNSILGQNSLLELTNMAGLVCNVVGMLLFIWGTAVSLAVKIVVSSHLLLTRLSDFYIHMRMNAILANNKISEVNEALVQTSQNSFSHNILLGIIFFILVFYFVSRWKSAPKTAEAAI